MRSLVQSDAFAAAPPSFNMAEYVLSQADRLATKPALEVLGRAPEIYSYRGLKSAILGTATGLLDAGLVKGDRVLLQLGNTADFPIAYLAAIAVGIIPVPLSMQLTTPELVEICGTLKPVLSLAADGAASASVRCLDVHDLRTFRELLPGSFHRGDPNRPAYIIYTSGTSGRPRAVVHAHRAVWARRMMWDGWYGLREDDRMLHAGAFNWTYTMGTGLMDPWSIGATALIPAGDVMADQLPPIMAEAEASLFAAAPGIYRRLLRADIPDLPHLRHGLCAGEKLSEADRTTWQRKTGKPIYEAFGMSECSTFISAAPATPAPAGSSGFVQLGRHVALIDENGPIVRGMAGTIAIHRSDPGLMLEYLDAPKETAARYQGDWFVTGDMAVMDDQGAITYAGRVDDMMNAGGYRVSPVEIEDVLTAHPHVSEAAACAVQVRTGVFVIAGFYVASDVIDEDEMRRFAATRLADYKMPRLLIARRALPRGANNKLLRRTLRDEWEAAHGQT